MSPRTGPVGLAVLVSILVVLGGAGPVTALSAAPAEHSFQRRSAEPTPTPGHEHEVPSVPTPSDEHQHEVPSAPTPSEGHEHGTPSEQPDHGSTPPDTVSDATRALVIGGFGTLNAGVLVAAALIRRRRR